MKRLVISGVMALANWIQRRRLRQREVAKDALYARKSQRA